MRQQRKKRFIGGLSILRYLPYLFVNPHVSSCLRFFVVNIPVKTAASSLPG